MSPSSPPDVTRLLQAWSDGDAAATDRLFSAVYRDLHRQAERYMRAQSPAHTLQATALVHEAYLRLAGGEAVDWKSRAHFFGVAAKAMRSILVDHARARRASKRGGGAEPLTLATSDEMPAQSVEVLELDEALRGLAELDARKVTLVELRWFGGLSIEEAAEVLEVSPATAKREWRTARAWLRRELSPDGTG
jgi:RNA polymerase sigma factor (TIGR02999 family)